MFKELTNDEFYKEFIKYNRCILDYGILKSDSYKGIESHKDAVIYLMEKIDNSIDINVDKMEAKLINNKEFFELPKDYNKEKHFLINDVRHRPYWFLFLNPPFLTNYTINDFKNINNLLFPKGINNLEIYDWNVDFSSFFDDGLEWWGARCISIYDKLLDRFVVILASATD